MALLLAAGLRLVCHSLTISGYEDTSVAHAEGCEVRDGADLVLEQILAVSKTKRVDYSIACVKRPHSIPRYHGWSWNEIRPAPDNVERRF